MEGSQEREGRRWEGREESKGRKVRRWTYKLGEKEEDRERKMEGEMRKNGKCDIRDFGRNRMKEEYRKGRRENRKEIH